MKVDLTTSMTFCVPSEPKSLLGAFKEVCRFNDVHFQVIDEDDKTHLSYHIVRVDVVVASK